jgi:hypothetical protein
MWSSSGRRRPQIWVNISTTLLTCQQPPAACSVRAGPGQPALPADQLPRA